MLMFVHVSFKDPAGLVSNAETVNQFDSQIDV